LLKKFKNGFFLKNLLLERFLKNIKLLLLLTTLELFLDSLNLTIFLFFFLSKKLSSLLKLKLDFFSMDSLVAKILW